MPDAESEEPKPQNDPLHGVTLKAMVEALQEKLGWDGLAEKIHAKCFIYEPSVQSSLVFLRRTPWAREKLEKLYMWNFHRPYLHKKYREKKGFDAPAAAKPPRAPERGAARRGPADRPSGTKAGAGPREAGKKPRGPKAGSPSRGPEPEDAGRAPKADGQA
jgi:uncharacterized protein (DUF2132 family)